MEPAVLVLLVDGLGDVALERYGDKTPLEYADTPTMNMLAKRGVCGLMDPVQPGLACGSDTAHLSIFGYDPKLVYRGRGAFEAMGSGMTMQAGNLAFKCNFAWVSSNGRLRRKCFDGFQEIGERICDDLDGIQLDEYPDVSVHVKYVYDHRCTIKLCGPNLSDDISGTDPLVDGAMLLKCAPMVKGANSLRTCRIVNQLSLAIQDRLERNTELKTRLENGQASSNVVLLRGAAAAIHMKPFQELHGMRPLFCARTPIIRGLCQTLDMDETQCKSSRLDQRLEAIYHDIAMEMNHDFGFVHVKEVDDAGHEKDVEGKVTCIEHIDTSLAMFLKKVRHKAQRHVRLV